jgi:predicted nucleic acid-binding Zn ribbon protein
MSTTLIWWLVGMLIGAILGAVVAYIESYIIKRKGKPCLKPDDHKTSHQLMLERIDKEEKKHRILTIIYWVLLIINVILPITTAIIISIVR